MTNNEFKEIKLYSDLSRDIKIKGMLLAEMRRQTGTGTYTRMEVYKTSGGNFGCQKVYGTQWQGDSDKYLAKICKTNEEVIEFYGLGDHAKELYYKLNIDICISENDYLENGNPTQEYQDLNEFNK